MITGIGTDIVLISRMEKFIEMGGMKRYFTEYEKTYTEKKANPKETAAGIYAAKEAFLKARGTGISNVALKDIEIRHDEKGKPFYNVSEEIKEGSVYHLSLSHDGDYAIAFAVSERRE